MAYNDFNPESVDRILGVSAQPADLFPALFPLAVPEWLRAALARGMQLSLLSGKARSEFIVVPILLASRELSRDAVAIDSGQRLDVNPEQGLVGECDFISRRDPARAADASESLQTTCVEELPGGQIARFPGQSAHPLDLKGP